MKSSERQVQDAALSWRAGLSERLRNPGTRRLDPR